MKIACVYHSIDLDGWMSAAVVKHWFETEKQEVQPEIFLFRKDVDTLDFLGYNYGQPIPDLSPYDKVIMCDISFPKKEMYILYSRYGKYMIWLDHHKSAIVDMSNTFEDKAWNDFRPKEPSESLIHKIEGLRDESFSACELTWKYFFPSQPMPEIVRLLGRYDCFGHKGTEEEQKVLEFQYGARQEISNYDDAYFELQNCIGTNDKRCDDIWRSGISIYNYLCTEAKQSYKNGFKITFEEDPEYATGMVYDFICINKERFNPINFGIDYHSYKTLSIGDKFTTTFDENTHTVVRIEPNLKLSLGLCYYIEDGTYIVSRDINECKGYDGAACFHYNGVTKLWNFSLYNDNGLVDCSVIAKQFGGGGHKGASGFVCDSDTLLKLINWSK